MGRFFLLLSPDHPVHGEASAGELGRRGDDFARWLRDLRRRGTLRAGVRLLAPGVRLAQPDSDPGRWESVESAPISGCLLIEAEDLEAVVELARGCPIVAPGGIDIFELDAETGLGGFGELP